MNSTNSIVFITTLLNRFFVTNCQSSAITLTSSPGSLSSSPGSLPLPPGSLPSSPLPPHLASLSVTGNNSNGDGSDSDDPNTFKWDDRPYREFTFTATRKVNSKPNDITCPMSDFQTFFKDDIIDSTVHSTNTYTDVVKNTPKIQERIGKSQRGLFQFWKEVANDKIWVYIAIQFLMRTVNKPNLHMY